MRIRCTSDRSCSGFDVQIQPYRTRDDRGVAVSRRLFGSGDERKDQDVLRLAGDSPKNGRA
jgi:hypothetical protein